MRKQSLGEAGCASTAPVVDRLRALELAAEFENENRLGFAKSFAAEIAIAYGEGLHNDRSGQKSFVLPSPGGLVLTPDAQSAARQIAAGIALLPVADAAYAIGSLYSTLLPEQFRAQHGIFYTPPALAECLLRMADESGIDWQNARVLDPACGGGVFLVAVAERAVRALKGVEPAIVLQRIGSQLRGFDIDSFGCWLARVMLGIALQPLARASGRGVLGIVETRDSLELKPGEAATFDLVIGNPPYGRTTLTPVRRQRFARGVYGHANLYGVFTDAALHWVKRGGVIGYVTPTSMLSGLYYKALRALLAAEAPPLAVSLVKERDGVFAGVLQETMLTTYRKGGLPLPGKVGFITVAGGKEIIGRGAGSFALPAAQYSPWLLPRSAKQAVLTKRLRSMPFRLADYGYGVSTGPLVWNRHKDQFRVEPIAGAVPVIWAEAVTSDGRFVWRSQKRNHAPWFMARRPKDDWLIVTQSCVLVQRTTAKEQARRLIAAVLPESFIRNHQGVTIENHLNMVRAVRSKPDVPAPVIAALLGSAAVDSAFRCINGSVAVSAFELEELPIPGPSFMTKLASLIAARAPTARLEAAIARAYSIADAPAAA